MPKYRIKRYGCKTLGELYERLDRYELVKTDIEIISYTASVRIGIIGIEYRIFVFAVSEIGNPYFGYIVFLCYCGESRKQAES